MKTNASPAAVGQSVDQPMFDYQPRQQSAPVSYVDPTGSDLGQNGDDWRQNWDSQTPLQADPATGVFKLFPASYAGPASPVPPAAAMTGTGATEPDPVAQPWKASPDTGRETVQGARNAEEARVASTRGKSASPEFAEIHGGQGGGLLSLAASLNPGNGLLNTIANDPNLVSLIKLHFLSGKSLGPKPLPIPGRDDDAVSV